MRPRSSVGAHLDAAHHLHAQALAQLASGGQPGSGVVVRERQALDASLRRLFEHLLERVDPSDIVECT
ncbi:MAG: hypothetical protein ACLTMP_10815 [Eggerthella lenta]